MANIPETPLTRKEQYLAAIAGADSKIPEKPLTREERYLAYIAENGGGGGGVAGVSSFNGRTGAVKPAAGDYSVDQITGLKEALDKKQGALTGNHGQLIGIGDDGAAKATVYPCNQNLLINWDFTNPVNRNGKTQYTEQSNNICTIDYWRLSGTGLLNSIIGQGLVATMADGSYLNLYQSTPDADWRGKQLTISAIADKQIGFNFGKSGQYIFVGGVFPEPDNTLYQWTWTVPDDWSSNQNSLYILVRHTDPVTIKAVKLELGPVQTLAHKEGDTWVLNEIPNYAEQYAICEQFSPITGEFVGSQHSNQNLIDNWYFIGGGSQQGGEKFPINQRGQTNYTQRYTVDRWRIWSSTSVNISAGDGILVTCTGETQGGLFQYFETLDLNTQYTFSALTKEYGLFSMSISSSPAPTGGSIGTPFGSLNISRSPSVGDPFVSIVFKAGQRATIIAAKLELGPVQTLAHKEGDEWVLNDPPPNYALELLKCQRYYQIIKTDKKLICYAPQYLTGFDFLCTMRVIPTVFLTVTNNTTGEAESVSDVLAMPDGVSYITVPSATTVGTTYTTTSIICDANL